MIDYIGYECPVCKQAFTENDDIVVCPICGAPHHRSCFAEENKCGCEDLHATNTAWADVYKNRVTKKCPHCGTDINISAVVCTNCGRYVDETNHDQSSDTNYTNNPNNPYGNPQNPYQNQNPFYRGPNGPFPGPGPGPNFAYSVFNGIDPNEDFNGVPASTVAKFIRVNPRYYMMVFHKIVALKRYRFNFAALILGCIWMLFRKQYRLGGILTIITAAVYAVSLAVSTLYSMPTLSKIYVELGISGTDSLSVDSVNRVFGSIFTLGFGQTLLFCVPAICTLVRIGINIFIAINANRWYYKHCTETIKSIETNYPTIMEREQQFIRRGGIQTMVIPLSYLVFMVSQYLIRRLL